jgi:proteasome lid subunit RPN8/RPN11
MALPVTRSALDTILAEADRALPLECCGLLLGTGAAVEAARPTRNVAADPVRHFEIDPQALVDAFRAERQDGPRLLGYYHSHPTGLAEPSATDRACASGDGRLWAIVAAEEITFWRDGEDRFERLPYVVLDG